MDDLSQTKDQLKSLLTLTKNKENINIETDIFLQIFSVKETERDSKKVYILSLCDQEYKLNSFFLASEKDIPDLKEGALIHLKEVAPKKIKNSTFIRIKEYEIIGGPQELPEVKEIKMEDFPFSEKK